MASSSHALLSASASKRWIMCNPSARLTEHMPDVNSDYSIEGSTAHLACEIKLSKALGIEPNEPTIFDNVDAEIDECSNSYVSYIMEIVEDLKANNKEPFVLVEQRLDYSKYVEDGFGTGDCLICSNGLIHIVDYKHGRGIKVD